MNYWLLDAGISESSAQATKVKVTAVMAPGDPKITVTWDPPTQYLELLQTGQHAAALALRVLWGEWEMRGRLAMSFRLNHYSNVLGHSSGLLLTLAIITTYLQGKGLIGSLPAIAATGDISGEDPKDRGAVRAVGHVPAKVLAAIAAAGDSPSLIFYPAANAEEIKAAGITGTAMVRLAPVAHIDEALDLLGIPLRRLSLRSPFRGLDRFDYEHRAVFFGRDADIRKSLVILLQREELLVPGLLIEGASGSGKSSFLRAGLLPALIDPAFLSAEVKQELNTKPILSESRGVIWRPSSAPEGSSEREIAQSIAASWSGFTAMTVASSGSIQSLSDLMGERRRCWPNAYRFVWSIDQLEEVLELRLQPKTLELIGGFYRICNPKVYGRSSPAGMTQCTGSSNSIGFETPSADMRGSIILGVSAI